MMSRLKVSTRGFADIIDITSEVQEVLAAAAVKEGIVCIFVSGSTAGITTMEYEAGLIEDLKRTFERMAPQDGEYAHNRKWGDGNGFSHVRASLLGPSLCIPVENGRLALGTWQQVVLIDFDNRPRTREVLIKAIKRDINRADKV
jgi:secondary thiamine-phosphate synthase enzyme